MASLQDRIKNIKEFRPDISFKDDIFVLKIVYRDKWTIIEPEDDNKVAISKDKKDPNRYWYLSAIDDSDVVFDLIEETIAVNKEMEKKLDLYKLKVKELQELFLSSETYDRLLNLQFVIPDEKKKGKKTAKKEVQTATEVAQNAEEATKNAYTDPITGKKYDQSPIASERPIEGVLMGSVDTIHKDSEIDKKIALAMGE